MERPKPAPRFLLVLAVAVAIRQLSLTVALPLLAVLGPTLDGQSSLQVGLALGMFGLTQALMQIPFGQWSDQVGRRPVVLFGLGLTAAGFLVAGLADHILTLVVARALQGSGAIYSVCYAWVGDRYPPEGRSQALGLISSWAGVAGVLGFVIGPLVAAWMSIKGVFLLCSGLLVLSMVPIAWALETDGGFEETPAGHASEGQQVLAPLLWLSVCSLLSQAAIMVAFYTVPRLVKEHFGELALGLILGPATLIGVGVLRGGLTRWAKGKDERAVIRVCFLSLAVGFPMFVVPSGLGYLLGMAAIMSGYLGLVTFLPSLATRSTTTFGRGRVMGIFNTFQFAGAFLGALCAGALWNLGFVITLAGGGMVAVLGLSVFQTLGRAQPSNEIS